LKASLGNRGYTLIEVLIVLLVLTVFLSLSLASFKPLKDTMDKKMIISQLEADLYYAQTYTISRQEIVTVQFYPAYNRYMMKTANGNVIVNRSWDTSVKLIKGSFLSFTILRDGNISRFGTLTFEINGHTFELIFNIGRGRFRVQE